MNSLASLFRYVADTDPPTLWTALTACFAELQKGQSEEYDVAAEIYRQVLRRRPETVRQMLNHERPLPMLDFEMVRRFCGLSVAEASALYMANAPSEMVGAIVRISELSGPRIERAYCVAPRAFHGFKLVKA